MVSLRVMLELSPEHRAWQRDWLLIWFKDNERGGMDGEVTLVLEGETYEASYIVDGDELTVKLPDGSLRVTELRGLNPLPTAKNHLRVYVGALLKNRST